MLVGRIRIHTRNAIPIFPFVHRFDWTPTVHAFVQQIDINRFCPHSRTLAAIPDIRLIRPDANKPILEWAERPASQIQITSRALPSVAGTELLLIGLTEAQQIVTRTGQPLHLRGVDHVSVIESTAGMWLGIDLVVGE
jgi:hypothetical protein